MLSGLASGPTFARGPHSEDQATVAARELVEVASHGRIDQAFDRANHLRRSDDTWLAQSLARQQHDFGKRAPKLGGSGRVLMPVGLEFGGCVTREFAVQYPNGTAMWVLKFRRNRDGYYLADLYVRA